MDQVSVGAVDRDHIHPRLDAAAGGVGERPHDLADLLRSELPRHLAAGDLAGHRRWRDRLEARDERLRDAPGVDQFHAEQGALGVHRAGEDPEAWDHVVVVGTHLAQASAPVCTDIGTPTAAPRPRRGLADRRCSAR